jgi:hypothetical protein
MARLTTLERAALQHAAAEQAYRRSPQARRDAVADRDRRAAADRKAGHSPACTLAKCAPDCGRER